MSNSPRSLESTSSGALKHARAAVILIPVLLIRAYQVIVRPLLIGTCKFFPTCSEYAVEALQIHGLVRGSVLAVRRLCRCHPFSTGGIDPVPQRGPPRRRAARPPV